MAIQTILTLAGIGVTLYGLTQRGKEKKETPAPESAPMNANVPIADENQVLHASDCYGFVGGRCAPGYAAQGGGTDKQGNCVPFKCVPIIKVQPIAGEAIASETDLPDVMATQPLEYSPVPSGAPLPIETGSAETVPLAGTMEMQAAIAMEPPTYDPNADETKYNPAPSEQPLFVEQPAIIVPSVVNEPVSYTQPIAATPKVTNVRIISTIRIDLFGGGWKRRFSVTYSVNAIDPVTGAQIRDFTILGTIWKYDTGGGGTGYDIEPPYISYVTLKQALEAAGAYNFPSSPSQIIAEPAPAQVYVAQEPTYSSNNVADGGSLERY